MFGWCSFEQEVASKTVEHCEALDFIEIDVTFRQ